MAEAGQRGDAALQGSGKKADRLLLEGYQGAVQDMAPYDRLGLQGSNALANYLGFDTAYTTPQPAEPQSVAQRLKEWETTKKAAATGKGKGQGTVTAKQKRRATARFQAAFDAETTKYHADLNTWQTDANAFAANQKGAEGFGDYFDPYTRDDLAADPVYQTELDENVRAWDQSAASRGSLMSGNTVAGLRDMTAAGIERGYNRDYNERERKFNALTGLNNMGLGVRTNLANARMSTASQRANTGVQVGTNRANTLLAGAGSQANFLQQGADALASGQLAAGTATGNAFNNLGSLGLLYGAGAFGNGNRANTPTGYSEDGGY
ncbi:MAG: hypothetical protein ACREIB_11620, partial [Pseudomonadota bacterium]